MLLSFALQVGAIGVFHQYRIRPEDDHFGFGWEMGRIGRSLATGHGFSSPYEGFTGPTAWEPPLYPLLMGDVFKVFGIYSVASAWVLLAINSLFNALTCVPIFLIARKMFGEKVARWSAWTWALLPYEMYWAIHWIWDTTIGPFLLACIVLMCLVLAEGGTRKHWAIYGSLWGVLALLNPSTLSFLLFSGLWIWYRRGKRGLSSLRGVALASVIFLVCVSPWLARNYGTFGKFVFIRNDFGYQLRLGNGPSADGMWMAYLQPNLNAQELETFKHLGEVAYEKRCRKIATDWIREHPVRFAAISLKRFFYYWGGVAKPTNSTAFFDFRNSLFLASSVLAVWGLGRALRKNLPGASLLLLLVLSYPTVYYFVYPHARYRHVIEPELVVLIVFVIAEAGKRGHEPSR